MRLSSRQIELLTNWDHLRPKRPFRNTAEECTYYARFLDRLLFRYLTREDWVRIRVLLPQIRIVQVKKDFVREVVFKSGVGA